MSNNSDPIQYVSNLFFSQNIKDPSKIKSDLFSSDNRPNTSRHNFKNTYEIQNYPNLIKTNKLLYKENNLNESSSLNDIVVNNKYNTYSNKYYSININNSLLNEQQSYSQIMKDNNDSSSHNNNIGNTDKMSISELKDEKSINNQNKKNKFMNENNNNCSDKKYFSHNNFAKNNYLKIDTGDDLDLNLINKDNNNNLNNNYYKNNFNYNEIANNDNNDKEGDFNNEDIENIEDNENENIEDNEENEISNNDGNKENKELEKFLIYSDNKDKMSQNENNYILFGINNSSEKDFNSDLLINKISQSNDNNQLNSKSTEHKRNFFSKIIDIEILIDTNEIYSKPWSQLINEIYNYLEQYNDSIQLISLGAQHTLCLSNQGKLFSFGWNNYSQCGIKNKSNQKIKFDIDNIEKINEIKLRHKIRDICTGEDHSLIITEKGKLYGFGLNNNGQLCYNPKKHEIISKPSLIKSFRKNNIINAQCTNNISFILSNKNEAFICPWEDQTKKINYIPLKIYFPNKTKITMISCGDNFSIFLSKNGNVYSMGSNNKYGQLGHGDTNIQLSPKLIQYFKNKNIKICQISCGYSHTLAMGIRGIPYSWGLGSEGQLGQGFEIEVSYTPAPIDFFEKNITLVYQVSAGNHNSYFLNEDNEVFFCGTNGKQLNKIFTPKKIEIKNKYRDLENNPCWICRILNCWNRSMSVFYAIFLDCNFINKEDEKVNNVLDLISRRWINQEFSADIIKGIDCLKNN